MTKTKLGHYTLEFKREAARLVEFSRLRAELARVTMECDILHPTDEDLSAGTRAWEKSTAVFVKGQK